MELKKTSYSSPPVLFMNSTLKEDNQDKNIDFKYQKRQEEFSNEEDFSKIKENTMSNELSLGQSSRNKIFLQRRLKKNIQTESTQSLKNKLTIPLELFEYCNKMKVDLSKFQEIIQAFRTQDISKKYTGLVGIRKLLILQNSPIQELIDIGITQELISLLDNSPPEFQYEALWCLISIATGTSDQANSIVVKGGVPKIIKLMDSPIEEIRLHSTWIIGNLASDSEKIRDYLLKEKAFEKLITILASTNHHDLIKNATWAISNFFKTKPEPPYENIQKCINMVARAMNILFEDKEFLMDACYILSLMTEKYKESIKELIDIGIIQNIIKLIDIDVYSIQIYCLRIVGNIASGNANQTQLLIDFGLLDTLKNSIFNKNKLIRKEITWILSNIAAGTQKQIEKLISENFLPILARVIKIDEIDIKKECIWAVCNLTSVENPVYFKKILEQGILEIICECLKMDDAKNLAVCLEAFGNILAFGKKNNPNGSNPIIDEVEKLGMFDILEKLQFHPVEFVYDKIIKILETYFETQNVE